MKIATFNVNSVRARLNNLTDWLKETAPDVVLLQEIKCEAPQFPALELKAAGYESLVKGQKAYHGVAILARQPMTEVRNQLGGDETDEQARYLEADLDGLRLIDIYLPNGNPLGTEKFTYKLKWLERLERHLTDLLRQNVPFLIGGDFNIIPEEQDARTPANWLGDALFQPESRAAWRRLVNLGLTDAYRALHPHDREYSFWDYQAGALQRDEGIRIDHFLLSPTVADRLESCLIDKAPRLLDKASDHTPVVVSLRNAA